VGPAIAGSAIASISPRTNSASSNWSPAMSKSTSASFALSTFITPGGVDKSEITAMILKRYKYAIKVALEEVVMGTQNKEHCI
jgi:hypothetical protein